MRIQVLFIGLLFSVIFSSNAQQLQSATLTSMENSTTNRFIPIQTEFFYDDKNRLTKFIIFEDIYIFNYDEYNRLVNLSGFTTQQAIDNNMPSTKVAINWQNNTITYLRDDQLLLDNAPIIVDNKGQVTAISELKFTYDEAYRISRFKYLDKERIFEYDKKPGLFKNITHCGAFCFLIPIRMSAILDLFLNQKNNLTTSQIVDYQKNSIENYSTQEFILHKNKTPKAAIYRDLKFNINYRFDFTF